MLTAVLLGFVLGLRHAFDPDHVIAVSTIVARHRSAWTASWIGVCWGIGHGATILAIGFGVIALEIAIPTGFARSIELGIGVLLVLLGLLNLLAAAPASLLPSRDAPLHASLARSGALGLVHGLAGSAPVALLAMAAMRTPAAALAYLLVFGLGTIAGMVAFSLALGAPVARLGASAGASRWVTAGTGMLSLLFGAWLIYEIGFAAAQRAAV
jgi:high-affinity nickel-transport protein